MFVVLKFNSEFIVYIVRGLRDALSKKKSTTNNNKTTIIIIIIIIKMNTADTGNRKENEYIVLFVSTSYFPPGIYVCNFDTQQTVTHVN